MGLFNQKQRYDITDHYSDNDSNTTPENLQFHVYWRIGTSVYINSVSIPFESILEIYDNIGYEYSTIVEHTIRKKYLTVFKIEPINFKWEELKYDG